MNVSEFIRKYHHRFKERAYSIDLFTLTHLPCLDTDKNNGIFRPDSETISNDIDKLPPGSIYIEGGKFKLVDDKQVISDNPVTGPCFKIFDHVTLEPGDLPNVKEKITTTWGRIIYNVIVVVDSFGDKIDFINVHDPKLGNVVSEGMLNGTISVEEHDVYFNNLFFLGHFNELCVPGLTERALVTDPEIPKVKKELLEKNKDRLNDPIVQLEIEDAVLSMDKNWIKGDRSTGFYTPIGSKTYNIHRKKIHGMVGMIEKFGGGFTFVENSLREGMTTKDFVKYANEARKGFYDRGVETALGGEQSKAILRIMQDLAVSMEDCGTTDGIVLTLTESNIKEYKGRFVVDKGVAVELTKDTMSKYIGKQVTMRSAMYCKAHPGLCYKCVGSVFAKLNIKAVGLLALKVPSTILTLSMKNMHGTKIELMETDPLKYFVPYAS